MRTDYLRLMLDESKDLADYVEDLPAHDWEAPSLCPGWRVRDVVAHMALGHTMPALSFGAAVVRAGFGVDEASYRLAKGYADAHSTEQILTLFRQGTQGTPRGAARLVGVRELFVDHLVHHQDIRRPLGTPRPVPPERGLAALRALHRLSPRVGSRRRMTGLHVVATDVPYERADGERELRGPAEALLMALAGRADPLSDLDGPGVDVLAARLGPTTTRWRTDRRPDPASTRGTP